MAASKGTSTIDFGVDPGTDEAKVTVSGQAGLISTTHIEVFIQHGDSTGTNDTLAHEVAAGLIDFSAKWTVDGSFEVLAQISGPYLLSGTIKFHYVWSN